MRAGILAVIVCTYTGIACQTAVGVAQVAMTSNVSTVAEGGSVSFTVTVTPDTYVSKVILTYEGEGGQDEDTTSPYNFVHQFNTAADDVTVTATVQYTNEDPDGLATLDVDVVGMTISGNTSPLRAYPCSYVARSKPTGKAVCQFDWTYTWTSGNNTYQDTANCDDQSVWYGKMVIGGTLSCNATISGVSVQKSITISITPRTWTVPITCATDNESDWGDVPIFPAVFGQHRDRDSNSSHIVFVPQDPGGDYSPAYTVAKVTLGPCTDLWYVSSSILKSQNETVINQYIKSGGPMPSGASTNFYTNNNANCFDAGDFVQAVANHEYRGTPPTYKSWEGHQGRLEQSIVDDDHDAKQHIEPLVNSDKSNLEWDIYDVITADEDAVDDYTGDESYMIYGPNWGFENEESLGYGLNSRWNLVSVSWTDCVYGPQNF